MRVILTVAAIRGRASATCMQLPLISLNHVAQIRRMDNVDNFDLIYGFTIGMRPNTEGYKWTIHDDDNINQYGAYGQAEYKLMDGKLSFLGALRLDYQDRIQELHISKAIVYKPAARPLFRGTYNRAFSAPTSLNFSLDLANTFLPNGVTIRGYGNLRIWLSLWCQRLPQSQSWSVQYWLW